MFMILHIIELHDTLYQGLQYPRDTCTLESICRQFFIKKILQNLQKTVNNSH